MNCTKMKTTPRGIRNNNPLNIRIGNTWLGERQHPTDNVFEQFVTLEYGLRAAFLILRRYIRRYKLNTPALIISRWAPSSENNTAAYIKTVCKYGIFEPDTVIDYADKDKMVRLVSAMVLVECGQLIDVRRIAAAYDMT